MVSDPRATATGSQCLLSSWPQMCCSALFLRHLSCLSSTAVDKKTKSFSVSALWKDFVPRSSEVLHFCHLKAWLDLMEESLPSIHRFILLGIIPFFFSSASSRGLCPSPRMWTAPFTSHSSSYLEGPMTSATLKLCPRAPR